jgi:hypothetical protein
MSERRCEQCGGTGKTGPVHINRGDAPHEWVDSMPCAYCVDGVVSDDLYEAQQLGKKLRASRIARQETIYEQARRLGISSAQLSQLQRGVGGMTAWHHPFATAAWLEASASDLPVKA